MNFDLDHSFSLSFPFVESWLHYLTGVVDLLAVTILVIGTCRFLYWTERGELASASGELRLKRQNLALLELGRYILSALELLIVADVIRTALSFRLEGILFLAGLVAVRSVISWFLDREIANLEKARRHDAPE